MDKTLNIKDYYDEKTKVIKMPKRPFDYPRKGEGYQLLEVIKTNFGKTALIDLADGKKDTYDELYKRIIRTAISMENLGIKPGDVITICSHNQIHSISVFLSAFLVGAVNASIDPSFPDEDITGLLEQVRSKIIFVSTKTEQRVENIIKKLGLEAKIVVFGESERNLQYADLIGPKDGENNFKPYIPENLKDTCAIMFSSGSTGIPKAMSFSHKFFAYHGVSLIPLPNIMSLSNIFWTGTIQAVLLQMKSGGTFSFINELDPVGIWKTLNIFPVTLTNIGPHVAIPMVENKPDDCDVHLPYMILVGTSTSKEKILKIRKILPNTKALSLYALTEMPNLFNCLYPATYEKVESIGRPTLGIDYKVVDPDTEENVGFNQRGELRLKSEYQLSGYYKRDSSNIWDQEGFLKTGDIVYFDEDFDFFVVDRIKEIFKRLGFHVVPVKLEAILENHPGVTMAAIVGIPNENDGNDIMAVVVPRKGSAVTPKEIEEYYNEKVAYYEKLTMGVRFVEKIPMTPTNKIARSKLKKMIMDDLGCQ